MILNTVQQKLAGTAKQGIKWITASVGNTVRMYSVDEVLFFQAQEKYTRVVTVHDEAFIRAPLKELVRALGGEGRGGPAHSPVAWSCGQAADQQRHTAPIQGDVVIPDGHEGPQRPRDGRAVWTSSRRRD